MYQTVDNNFVKGSLHFAKMDYSISLIAIDHDVVLGKDTVVVTFFGEAVSQLSITSDFITPGTELSVFQSVQSSWWRPPSVVHVGYIDTPVPAVERNISLHPEKNKFIQGQ